LIAASAIVALWLFAFAVPFFHDGLNGFTLSLFLDHDLLIVPLFAVACLVGARPAGAWQVDAGRERLFVWIGLALIVLVCWAGHLIVMSDFDTVRDERMVVFDAAIFRDGALTWPIPNDWRPVANALNRRFMLPIGSAEAWVSAYLPVNAAFHAVIGLVADDDLTSPLMVAAGGFFLWRIALRLFPDSALARIATLAFYVGSSQILITGMTKFAMSGHLALNLAWLWLFLRGGTRSHALAMVVGFLATGLHQPLFHPLFVLPFLGLLALRKDWKLLGSYLAAYACIAAFWLAWPIWIASTGTGPVAPISTSAVGFGERLLTTVKAVDLDSVWLTAVNLIRFVAWQHPLLMPLALFGSWAAWRSDPLVRALAVSALLPVFVLWILLPWQGLGWGYRYLHPALGSVVLLGGWGVYVAERRLGLSLARPLGVSTAGALLLLFPLHAWMAYQFVLPRAQLDRSIGGLNADVAILDEQVYSDFAHNRPDLSNRPIRLLGGELRPGDIGRICRGRSITFVDAAKPAAPSEAQQRLKAAALASGCNARQVRAPLRP
jgi:hypothetical protein